MSLQSNNYLHITGNGTYVIKTTLCGLETVKVNAADAGTILITEGNPLHIVADDISNGAAYKHDFDLANLVGCIVTVAGSSTNCDITVIYQ